ncbi:MAG TPA: phosphatase PAP2 family protein [Candidatus Aminicenantes bacterium]|nr:phosphatase PAP2 family protein [Candidatus Aminicenantes bacterium]HRY65261.1 phosphatase PAP2 family protein [Candidatus Aminicenantes bacterium]HRZ72271.1 phosphatase PAP2 family protein [Candidatus Aminicenantes bacterium]
MSRVGKTCRRAAAAALVLACWSAAGLPAFGAAAARAGSAPAATPGPSSEETDRLTPKEAGREFLRDAGRIWSAPARLRARDLAPVFVLGVAATILVASDGTVRDGIQSYAGRHAWVGDAAPVITHLGGAGGLAAAGAFLGAGLLFKDGRARDTGYLAASAILQSFLADTFLKGLAGRQRPLAAGGLDHWAGPAGFYKRFEKGRSEFYDSFPSGHSAAAFALATVVSLQYRHEPWVGVLSYTLATAVGLSRLALDKHWLSDVVAGAAVGHFVGRLVVHNHGRRPRLVPTLACFRRGFVLGLSYDPGPPGR